MSGPIPPASSPIPPTERIDVIDILRGFAIFGILLVNMELFTTPIYQAGMAYRLWPGWADRAADGLIRFLAEGKFYTLFSFLFGFGLSVQMGRAQARGARFVPLYARRLLVLLLIGAAHALLVWVGDILVSYAVLGFVLLLFRNRSPRTLLVSAAATLLLTVLINAAPAGLELYGQRSSGTAERVEQRADTGEAAFELLAQQATRAYAHGTFAEIQAQRVRDLRFLYLIEIFAVFSILTMFLLGLYAGRRGIFQDVHVHAPFIRRAMQWGFGIGIAGNLTFAITEVSTGSPLADLAGSIGFEVGAPALSIAYMSAITLLAERDVWRRRLMPLVAVGRTALSNYLLQSLVCTTIFYGYGLGLFGQVGPAAGAALAVAVYAIQIPLSVWWLRRFQFGPMEWLWRSLTYMKRQPMIESYRII